jgi:outer membrane protein TolC
MHWKSLIAVLSVGLAAVIGCRQPIYMTESDVDYARRLNLPESVAVDPNVSNTPDLTALIPTPPTVLHPERSIKYVSLAEVIATALERGTIGVQGTPNDNLVSFAGTAVAGSDAIRVLALDPAIVGANMEIAESKFDAHFVSSLTWSTTDRPVGTALDQFQTGATGINAIRTDAAEFKAALLKPLPTGGVAGITFDTPYQFTNLASRVNPSYTPSLQFQFEQPLLQGFGVEINQLRSSHPGSVLTPFNITGGRVEGILITRIRFDQERAEFERQVHNQLINVETAYWNLYAAYYSLYARDLGLRQALEIWKIAKLQTDVGKALPETEPQTRGTYEQFRNQRLTALGVVLESERRLRRLMGIPIEDGTRLVPGEVPTLAKYPADWNTAVQETLALRPELVLARQDLKFRQLDLINQKNLLLPDLRSLFSYNVNSIGSRLDGPDATNAFRNLSSDHFNNWTMGLQGEVALGYREANSLVRIARLNLARSYRVLREQEDRAVGSLTLAYRQLDEFQAQIAIQRSQRETYAKELQIRNTKVKVGNAVPDINLLTALNNYANALASEFQFVAQYNIAIAQYEFDKGTIMQRDNVQIGEGALTDCAAVRAVDHERERAAALILRERANPVDYSSCKAGDADVPMPELPQNRAPSLPALLEKSSTSTADLLAVPPMPPADTATKKADRPAPKPMPTLGNNVPYVPASDSATKKADGASSKVVTPGVSNSVIVLPSDPVTKKAEAATIKPAASIGSVQPSATQGDPTKNKTDSSSAKPVVPPPATSLPYVSSGTGVVRVGQPSTSTSGQNNTSATTLAPTTSTAPTTADGPKVIPGGVPVDTGWTPRP